MAGGWNRRRKWPEEVKQKISQTCLLMGKEKFLADRMHLRDRFFLLEGL